MFLPQKCWLKTLNLQQLNGQIRIWQTDPGQTQIRPGSDLEQTQTYDS